jgi:ribosomal protein S18 acetylase RimI-like enzyme
MEYEVKRMYVIKQIERYTDIMFSFEPKIRYFADTAANGAVFCAFINNEPAGIICLRGHTSFFDTFYIYVKEAHRNQGIASALTAYAANAAKSEGKRLRFRIVQRSEYAAYLKKLVQKLNMQLAGESTFFRLNINQETRSLWEAYRQKIIEMIAKVEKKTGKQRVISYAEADKALLNQLNSNICHDLPEGLNPFSLPGIDLNFSIIVIRVNDGEPIACNAVRIFGKKMIYDLSYAQKGQTGIAGALVFFDRLYASGIEQVTCVVHNSNIAGMSHVRKRFGILFKEQSKQMTYEL